jgi:type IV pilus assembly protein PilW
MMKKQGGVTLIELMISLVLGLGLIAGIGSLFVQSQKSFRLQRNVSDMTDDAAFFLENLAKGLLLAGYTVNGTKDFPTATNTVFPISGSPSVPDISFSNVNEYIRGLDETSNDGKGDQLVYRFKLSNLSELNNTVCTSFTEFKNAVAAGVPVGKTITVRIFKRYDSDINAMVFYSKPAVENVSYDAQPIISDVEKLEFKYGVRSATDSFYFADATAVTTANQWHNVFAVKVFIVMRSADDNVVRVQTGYKIDGVQQTPLPSDKRLYKTFTKTIYLRTNEQ